MHSSSFLNFVGNIDYRSWLASCLNFFCTEYVFCLVLLLVEVLLVGVQVEANLFDYYWRILIQLKLYTVPIWALRKSQYQIIATTN